MALEQNAVFAESRGPIVLKSWSFKEKIRALRRSLHTSSCKRNVNSSLSYRMEFSECKRSLSKTDIWRALSPDELPDCANIPLIPSYKLSREVFASGTGPKCGIFSVEKWLKVPATINGVRDDWKQTNRKAHGISVSLYEKNPLTGRLSGEPLADSFVFRARRDSAFLAVADGVNWGRESMQAARCAVYSVYKHLESRLYGTDDLESGIDNTKQAANLLFEAFSIAQDRIVSLTTGLTTLCVALVLPVFNPLDDMTENRPEQFAVVVASVGDSQAYLLSKYHGIRELTGMETSIPDTHVTALQDRNGHSQPTSVMFPPVRDFRYTGGALGAVYPNGNPELHNLTCAVTLCDPGDMVILGTDGLTDNFDPVITQVAIPESPQLDFVDEQGSFDTSANLSKRMMQLPAKSWSSAFSISPPAEVCIWPRPPPPPTQPSSIPSGVPSNPKSDDSDQTMDCISAASLNFTNRLELNWSERRKYAEKAIERVWHEIDAITLSPGGQGGVTSSRDLCESLITEVLRVTAEKRELLSNPDLARLRMHPDRLRRLNVIPPEEELGSVSAARAKREWLRETLKFTSGKLDHATVVVYEAGVYHGDENEDYESAATRVRSCDLSSL